MLFCGVSVGGREFWRIINVKREWSTKRTPNRLAEEIENAECEGTKKKLLVLRRDVRARRTREERNEFRWNEWQTQRETNAKGQTFCLFFLSDLLVLFAVVCVCLKFRQTFSSLLCCSCCAMLLKWKFQQRSNDVGRGNFIIKLFDAFSSILYRLFTSHFVVLSFLFFFSFIKSFLEKLSKSFW